MNEDQIKAMLQRRSLPCLDERVVLARVAKKVERAFERLAWIEADGTLVVLRCAGIVCREHGKHYVETGIVGIDLPKFGDDNLYDRLTGNWVN